VKKESKGALNVRDVPKSLIDRCKAKAALLHKPMGKFIQDVLREATKDIPELKGK
jgi:hypothetical protein